MSNRRRPWRGIWGGEPLKSAAVIQPFSPIPTRSPAAEKASGLHLHSARFRCNVTPMTRRFCPDCQTLHDGNCSPRALAAAGGRKSGTADKKSKDAPRPSKRAVSTSDKPCPAGVANGNPPSTRPRSGAKPSAAKQKPRSERGHGERSRREGHSAKGDGGGRAASVSETETPSPTAELLTEAFPDFEASSLGKDGVDWKAKYEALIAGQRKATLERVRRHRDKARKARKGKKEKKS